MRGYKLRKSWPPPSDLCKYSKFQKTDNTRRSTWSRSKKPKNCRPEQWATRHHAPLEGSEISASTNTLTRAPQLHDVMMTSLTTFSLILFLGPDPNRWPGSNRLRKNALTKFDLWLWPKSQNFQKMPVPLSFLYTFWFWNPFLCSRLGNCANYPISKKLTFTQILTKKSNFQESLVLPNFSRRFQFWGLFLHSGIRNCSNSMIL